VFSVRQEPSFHVLFRRSSASHCKPCSCSLLNPGHCKRDESLIQATQMEFLGLIKGFYEESRTSCSGRGRSGGSVSSHQLLSNFSALYWTRRLITVFPGPYSHRVNVVQILETHFFRINFNIIPRKRNTRYSEAGKRQLKYV
jgi:hypothetical protein